MLDNFAYIITREADNRSTKKQQIEDPIDLNMHKGTSKNLLRVPIAALGGARNPHVLHVRSGFYALSALHSSRS